MTRTGRLGIYLLTQLPPSPPFPEAACQAPGVDPHWFFPQKGEPHSVNMARAICAACPHREPCADWAISVGPALHGIWGGLSPKQRNRLRNPRQVA